MIANVRAIDSLNGPRFNSFVAIATIDRTFTKICTIMSVIPEVGGTSV